MSEKIYFAHGNGFPALSYLRLLNCLNSVYECNYLDKIGHNPNYPVTDNWDYLVKEIIDNIQKKYDEPIIGVGHSLGGVLILLAAIRQPHLFKLVIMIDSPLINKFKSSMIKIAKLLKFIDNLTPASRALARRTHWNNKKELISYLQTKPLFKTFREDCLNDYIDFGFEKTVQGYTLTFDNYIEYLIFRTLPHDLPSYERQLNVPTALIYGNKSTLVKAGDVSYMKKKFSINAYSLPGGHMLPFEQPELVGEKIIDIISNLNHSKF